MLSKLRSLSQGIAVVVDKHCSWSNRPVTSDLVVAEASEDSRDS